MRASAALLILAVSLSAEAQAPAANTYVFPLFVDGRAGAVIYKSALKVLNINTSNPALQCKLSQRQTDVSFTGLNGDRYYADIFDSGDHAPALTTIALDRFLPWEILRSGAASSLQSGYAVLSCPGEVHAELTISLSDSSGNKLGETLLPPAATGNSFSFLIDTRDRTRLGYSIANDSDIDGEYTLIARDEFNQEVDRITVTLTARSQESRFVDELLHLPANFVGMVEIVGVPGARSYCVGLQFTGGVFSTVQPLVRDVPLSH